VSLCGSRKDALFGRRKRLHRMAVEVWSDGGAINSAGAVREAVRSPPRPAATEVVR
jgi:hypothetical protein